MCVCICVRFNALKLLGAALASGALIPHRATDTQAGSIMSHKGVLHQPAIEMLPESVLNKQT